MAAQEASNEVQIGEWMAHPALDSISRGTETHKLEPRAMRLLMCLANSPGEVVSIDRLLTEVWAGVVVGSASVYETVSQLRKILGDVEAQPTYIVTVPRKGYRQIAPVRPGMTSVDASRAQDLSRRPVGSLRIWAIAGAFVAFALVVAYFSVDKGKLSKHATTGSSIAVSDKSIAVLPFTDMSEKKDQEYFADGMAEEIINLLVKIPGLKVISRTSSFQFTGKTEVLRSIGTQLGVAYVLEGSVRKAGDRLRVTAQLIDSRNSTHLWSQTYDRDLSDILKMQDEIAMALVRALKIEVSPLQGLEARPALRNTEAYALYLHGLHDTDRNDLQGFELARSEFQRALDLDPTFAEAAGVLAATYAWGASVGYIPPGVGFEQARDAAEHAIKLDPNNPIAYSVLGDIHNTFDWDWPAADQDLKRTLALAPNNPVALQIASRHSLAMGRWDDALNLATASLALDPLDIGGYYWLSTVQLRRGRLPEAEAAIRRALEIAPTFPFGPYALGVVLLARSQPQAALTAFSKEPLEAARIIGSAMAYFALKRKAESDASLAQMLKSYAYIPFGIATIYAFRGESDEAFKWLDRAYEQKDQFLYRIKFAPEFDKLHGDPRYKAFLTKMNLPEMTQANN
jgi:TolB-like protein/DNA-binding winged helix-turn-helix (wHTH) protein/Flp pilus assembly protein TadD